MIQRFEDEYPETKIAYASPPNANGMPSPDPSMGDASLLSGSFDSNGLMKLNSAEEYFPAEGESPADPYSMKLSRTSSNPSLAAKAYTNEEGRMLRFGQTMRRDILKPTGMDDALHGTSQYDDPEPAHLAALRAKLEKMTGEDVRSKVERQGSDSVIRELGINAQELLMLQKEDPEGFEAFRNSQLAAQINAGMIDANGNPKQSA